MIQQRHDQYYTSSDSEIEEEYDQENVPSNKNRMSALQIAAQTTDKKSPIHKRPPINSATSRQTPVQATQPQVPSGAQSVDDTTMPSEHLPNAVQNNLLEQLADKVNGLQLELDVMAHYRREYNQLSNQYFELESNYNQLKTHQAQIEQQDKDVQNELQDTKDKLRQAEQRICDMQRYVSEYNQLTADRFVLLDSNKALRLRVKELTDELCLNKSEMANMESWFNLQLEQSKHGHRAHLTELWSGYATMCNDFESMCKETEGLQAERKHLVRQVAYLIVDDILRGSMME